jgi:predicted short-subunit dehydrogenase-like oxidoreductase (DUF2520 family)
MRIVILGAGKLGSALAKALRDTPHPVTLRRARSGIPRAPIGAELLVLAVRDSELSPLAEELARSGAVSKRTAVVHVAGALGPEVLSALAGRCAGVGQAHPLVSFASRRRFPSLEGAHLLVDGEPVAVHRSRRLGRAIGMVPRRWTEVDRGLYHAAAGLVANGAAALAAAGVKLLVLSGCPERVAPRVLAPLLRSVAENIDALGLPQALTGPVRRGDVETVRLHFERIGRRAPELAALYRECVRAQLPMATRLEEASSGSLRELARLVRQGTPSSRERQ